MQRGVHVALGQGSLTFVLPHRTALKSCVGNTCLICSAELLRAMINTFMLFITGRPFKGILILFGIEEWFGELE